MFWSRPCSDEVDASRLSPAGLTTANRMFPICAPFKAPELRNTRVLVVHLLRIKVSCEKDGLHQSRMFPTLVILNAPKSGTPDFDVKPGNDGGNRGTSVRIHSTEIGFSQRRQFSLPNRRDHTPPDLCGSFAPLGSAEAALAATPLAMLGCPTSCDFNALPISSRIAGSSIVAGTDH